MKADARRGLGNRRKSIANGRLRARHYAGVLIKDAGRPRVGRGARTLDASQPLVYDPGVVAVVNNLLVVEAEGVLWEHALREKSAAIAVIVVAAWKSGASKLWYSCGEFKKMLLNACCEGIRYGLAMVDLVAGACEIDDA